MPSCTTLTVHLFHTDNWCMGNHHMNWFISWLVPPSCRYAFRCDEQWRVVTLTLLLFFVRIVMMRTGEHPLVQGVHHGDFRLAVEEVHWDWVSVVGVMVSMIRTQPHPLLLLLWAWLRIVWDLSVILQHYAMTHCSTCNAHYSWCVNALGLQSNGGFDYDLLLWSSMLWRLIWLYIAGLECFLHGSMQPESLAFVLWIWLRLSIGLTMDSISLDNRRGGFFHDMAAQTSTDYDEYCDYSLFHLYDTWQLNSHYVLTRALDFFFL